MQDRRDSLLSLLQRVCDLLVGRLKVGSASGVLVVPHPGYRVLRCDLTAACGQQADDSLRWRHIAVSDDSGRISLAIPPTEKVPANVADVVVPSGPRKWTWPMSPVPSS